MAPQDSINISCGRVNKAPFPLLRSNCYKVVSAKILGNVYNIHLPPPKVAKSLLFHKKGH